jgi:deoxyribodipyrimidine photo-lyase
MNRIQVQVVYFQHDLRIMDQGCLAAAQTTGLPIIGIYLFSKAQLEPSTYGFSPMGPYRFKFLWDSLQNLKTNLATYHIPFYLFDETSPIQALFATHYDVVRVFASVEPGSEELALRNHLLTQLGQPPLTLIHDKSLLHPDLYPWLISDLPRRYTDARIRIEATIRIQPLLPPLKPQGALDLVADDHSRLASFIPKFDLLMPGGETEALRHLHQYFFVAKKVLTYKATRNNMLAFDDSSKLSPALSLGLLSPRYIYWQLKAVEQTVGRHPSTYALWFELLWRDYFYYLHLDSQDTFFKLEGLMHVTTSWSMNPKYVKAILEAKTGYPLVDANLIELYQTGWMSNRGRQNVASFMSKTLKLDWRFGAALFEHYLIDYDVSSNYGNWQYISGVGVDPREDRVFNVSLQAKKYDPTGAYLHHWLPVLAKVPVPQLFQPWTLNALEMGLYACNLGNDYPLPIVNDPRVQLKDR